jgi:hypothetical protein
VDAVSALALRRQDDDVAEVKRMWNTVWLRDDDSLTTSP